MPRDDDKDAMYDKSEELMFHGVKDTLIQDY